MLKFGLHCIFVLALIPELLFAKDNGAPHEIERKKESSTEHLRLSISTDNDLFAPGNTDKDYTAGFAISVQSFGEQPFARVLDQTLGAIDASLLESLQVASSGLELGSYGFTPNDIEAQQLDLSDRPYASLVYLSANRNYRSARNQGFWTSSLTIGLLGVDVFEFGQKTVHKIVTGDKARGWDSQISEGGELTARYQLAYHHPLAVSIANQQLKTSYFGSIGYLTEAGVALSLRKGLISSPDYRFNPAVTSYGEQTNASDAGSSGKENYFWGGVGLKLRAYNAFLEGQVRDSAHTFRNSQLRPIIAELWAGYTFSMFESTKFSYVFRAHSSEIRSGTGDRNLMWGGFVLSFNLD